ncbi:conserved exported hypothetical protein [groundwater metagenome]|uniref:Uncharacterized protein n=1 Tax=groundwater metagenome TaxID=717931 RepID=A0A098E7Y6_9ZZZZ
MTNTNTIKGFMRNGAMCCLLFLILVSTANATTIDKTVDKTTAVLGENLTYTITLNFTENASNLTLNDPLPDGLIYVNDSHNGTLNNKTITWNLGNITGIVEIILNVSLNETYNGTEIVNNSVNLSYGVNGTNSCTNATSPKVKINKTTPNVNIAFIGGYAYQGLIISAINKTDLNLNITIYPLDNLPENISLLNQDVIFIDSAGVGFTILGKINQTVNDAKEKNNASVISMGNHPYNYLANVNLTNHPWIGLYWRNGGAENIKRLLIYLGVKFCGLNGTLQEPIVIPDDFIYHPDSNKIFENLTAYLEWYGNNTGTHHLYDPDKPTVGIVSYKSDYTSNHTELLDTFVRGFETREVNIIVGLFSSINPEFYMVNNTTIIDVLVSLKIHRINYGSSPQKGVDDLKKINVSVLGAIQEYYQTNEEWNKSQHGLSINLITGYIAQPEMDGVIEPMLITTKETDPITGVSYQSPIDYQMDWLFNRTIAWTKIKRANNSNKKIAVVYYNYPPGKASIGASYLNVMSSITNLLDGMQNRGYNTGNINPNDLNDTKIRDLILSHGRNVGVWAPGEIEKIVKTGNVTLIPENKYLEWFNGLPENKKNEVIVMWGQPPGKIMIYANESGKYLVIPHVLFGNILLAPEPAVGNSQDQSVMYHDKSIPPNHQYIAFYFWLTREYGADAIIHVGTHATHEWRPGKEIGLSIKDCWPVILMQNLPNPYIYIMDNIGEGTQAKRRGMADIIDHLTPPIVASGLYGNLSELHQKTHIYADATTPPAVKQEYRNTMIELYKNLNFEKDLNVSVGNITNMTEAEFDAFFVTGRVHEYLHELAETNMPYGLHILGKPPTGEKLIAMVNSMLGNEFEEDVIEIYPCAKHNQSHAHGNYTIFEQLLHKVIINGTSPEDAQIMLLGNSSNKVTAHLNTSIKYAKNIEASQIETSRVLDALEGKYIPPAPGNDPIRNPDALPTGRNFYSFDPRIIPTKEAWEVGKKMANQLLGYHQNKTGKYPEKVAFVLWATELMRHYGVSESEILYLMGVKPVWDKKGNVENVTLINCTELKRPRIDVVMTTSGLYRDQFSTRMVLWDQAVKLAAKANDSECNYTNFVKEHSNAIYEWLINQGYNESVAYGLSMARIFSEAPGSYGTGLQNAIHESHSWENESKIADLYIGRMSHIYGKDIWGEQYTDLFKQNLNGVEAAVHIDSSNLYSTLDNDDFFQYLGGLNLAVRSVTGRSIDLYVTNFQDPKNPTTETLSDFLTKELRTRYFNPYWIKGMQNHGYDGARTMSETFENLWGWEATSPEIVTDYLWNEMYDVYVNDKYDMGLEDWFGENNPYALQSITARMLEVIRKGYWEPSDDVKKKIAETYQNSVEEYGVTCCGHTCGNPFLDDYIEGILSPPPQELPTKRHRSKKLLEEPTLNAIQQSQPQNATASLNATGEAVSDTTRTGEEEKNDTAITPPEKPLKDTTTNETKTEGVMGEPITHSGETVTGKKMEKTSPKTETEQPLPISGAPLIGILIVIAILIFIIYGYLRKKK